MAVIVLADDDRNNRFVIGTHLRMRGHRVLEAANGREALEWIEQGETELAILDLMMPDMNGEEACRALRANPRYRDLPVVMLSALDPDLAGRENNGARFDAAITKPFRIEELHACIERLLRKAVVA